MHQLTIPVEQGLLNVVWTERREQRLQQPGRDGEMERNRKTLILVCVGSQW